MEFLIISGMSGAGKSLAADILEDMDYYCVDNMPVALLPRFAELCLATRGRYERVALVTDVRERESISGLIEALDRLWAVSYTHLVDAHGHAVARGDVRPLVIAIEHRAAVLQQDGPLPVLREEEGQAYYVARAGLGIGVEVAGRGVCLLYTSELSRRNSYFQLLP